MRLGGRIVAMLFAVAGLLGSAPAPAEAAQNCTLTRTGDVYCSDSAAPVRIQVTGRVVQLAANGDSTCALTEPGEVYCWSADGPAEEPGPDLSPLVLVTVGLLLVGGGVTLVTLGRSGEGRPQDARSKAASRNLSAPSLSRSV